MRLLSLKLKGFKGIKAGMGVDELTLDLSKLPAGLIAIVGKNGAGKSTVMDNLHPYRLMPFKLKDSKEWTPGAFSYYDHTYGEAMKELIFEIGDVAYKSLILIDADRRKQEAFLYVSDSEAPFCEWKPLCSGKVKDYDEAVEKICGSPSLFFTSVFRAQDARKISSYPRSEIMAVICELLQVDHIKEQSVKAREVANALLLDLDKCRDKIAAIDAELEQVDALSCQEQEVMNAIDRLEITVADAHCTVADLQEQRRATELSAAAQIEAKKRLADLESRREELFKEVAAIQETANAETFKAKTSCRRVKEEADLLLEKCVRLEMERKNTVADIARISALLDSVVLLEAETTMLPDAIGTLRDEEEEVNRLRKEFADRQADLAKVNALKERRRDAEKAYAELAGARTMERSKLEQKIAEAKKQSAMLDGIDCRADGSGWINEQCQLLTHAVASKHALSELSDKLAMVGMPNDKEKDAEAILDSLNDDLAALPDPQPELTLLASAGKTLADRVAQLRSVVDDLRDKEKKAAAMRIETVRLPDLEASVTRLVAEQQELETARQNKQTEIEELEREVAAIKAKHDLKAAEVNTAIGDNGRAITDLKQSLSADVDAVLADISQKIAEAEHIVSNAQKALVSRHGELGGIRSQLVALTAKKEEKTVAQAHADRIAAETAHWKLLEKACGNDGIVALELDDAGPAIATLANDLLIACYGNRFSVRLETQTAKANGDLKETFDIVVYDAERDEVKSIRDMSGGETVYINDAITRAICLYNVGKSSREFGTIFADESDGALDADRKLEFIKIKRKALELGSHDREIFITQTSDLWDMADARIMLAPGGVTIQ